MLYLTCTICIVLALALSIQLWLFRRSSKGIPSKVQKHLAAYKSELNDANQELKRQAVVINDYKKQLKYNSTNNINKISRPENRVNEESIQTILTDKQQLEKEKELFKQKNQKLWQQSLAVYKEKERIDSLRKYIESNHADLTDSINYALHIQEALLPSDELLNQILPNYFLLNRPRNIVSGDFYWTQQKDNKTILVVADCTGHGVPGAFMSMLGISFLNEIASTHPKLSAAQIAEEMRRKVKSVFQRENGVISSNNGMDMVICIVDHKTHKLEFSGANNGILIAKQDQTLTEIKGTRNPISAYPIEKPFENHTIDLQVNDSIFLYSDGYCDQFGGPKNKKITKGRLKNILAECNNKKMQIHEIKNELESFLGEWQGDESQTDDILVLGITFFTDENGLAL